MKKKLNSSLTLYYNTLFPSKIKRESYGKNRVIIGVGGNIGNTTKIFKKLILMLNEDGRFAVLESSPILQNPPFGYLEQEDFKNALIVLETKLNPFECLRAFQRYEKRFKRVRTFQDAPRTLDIDIIFFNTLKLDTKLLTLPHKGYKNRQSVQIPLKFLSTKTKNMVDFAIIKEQKGLKR